jgi:hypothetical protein
VNLRPFAAQLTGLPPELHIAPHHGGPHLVHMFLTLFMKRAHPVCLFLFLANLTTAVEIAREAVECLMSTMAREPPRRLLFRSPAGRSGRLQAGLGGMADGVRFGAISRSSATSGRRSAAGRRRRSGQPPPRRSRGSLQDLTCTRRSLHSQSGLMAAKRSDRTAPASQLS